MNNRLYVASDVSFGRNFQVFGNINRVTLTTPATGATLTLADGSTLSTAGSVTHAGAFAQTFTATAATNVTLPTTGTLATLAGAETLSNKTLTTPVLGVATATSINKVAFTQPANGATLTLAEGSTLSTAGSVTHVGAFAQTFTATAATNVTLPTTGTLATLAGAETLTNKTLTNPVIGAIVNTGTLTLPTTTDTLVGRNTTDTLTNKTLTAPTISTITNSGTLTLPTGPNTLATLAGSETLTNKTITTSGLLTANSDVSFNQRLYVASDVSFNRNFQLFGQGLFVSDVSINGRLSVAGDLSLNGRLFLPNNAIYTAGSLFVGGSGGASVLSGSGDANIGSRLFVGSDASFGGNFFIPGTFIPVGITLSTTWSASAFGNTYSGANTSINEGGPVCASSTLQYILTGTGSSAGGSGSSPYFTSSYGANWRQLTSFPSTKGASMSSTGQYILLAPQNNAVLSVSSNFGVSFYSFTSSVSNGFVCGSNLVSSTGQYMIVSTNVFGNPPGYFTTNYGFNWNRIATSYGTTTIANSNNNATAAISGNGQYMLINSSNNNLTFLSSDYGNWFNSTTAVTSGNYIMAAMSFSGQYISVGTSLSSNYGTNWTTVPYTICSISYSGQYISTTGPFLSSTYGQSFVSQTNYGLSSNTGTSFIVPTTAQYVLYQTGTNLFTLTNSVINNTSYMGIGKQAPQVQLDISGDIQISNRAFINAYGNDASLNFRLYVGSDASLNSNLFVNGTVAIGRPTVTSGFAVDVSGGIQATNYNLLSDYRIKTNVQELDGTFHVDNLRPVSYYNTVANKQDIGLIAHEIQQHYPYLVHGEKDAVNYQSVNYTGIIGVLIHEIQELKKRVNELENRP
jgi:hypothetical protein